MPNHEEFTLKSRRQGGKLFTIGCPLKVTNFGTLHDYGALTISVILLYFGDMCIPGWTFVNFMPPPPSDIAHHVFTYMT